MKLKNLTFFGLLKESWILYSNNLLAIWRVYGFLVFSSLFLYYLNELYGGINSLSGKASFIVAIGVTIFFTVLVEIAFYLQLKNVVEEHTESVQKVFFKATPLFWMYLLTVIVHGLLLSLATILFIIPGIVFFFFWIFYKQAAIYHKLGPMQSLDYSFSLVRERWWMVTGYFLGFLVVLSPFYILTYFGSFGSIWIEMFFFIVFLFFSAYIGLAQVMFFYYLEDTRIHPKFSVSDKLLEAKYKVKAARRSSKKKKSKKGSKKKSTKARSTASRLKKTKKKSVRKSSKKKTSKRKTSSKKRSRR